MLPLGRAPAAASSPPRALAGRVELAQQTAHLVGHQGHQAARRRAVRELRVGPQVARHLQQVRLAAAEEPADPRGLLACLGEVGQERRQEALDAVGVLALAHERRQLAAQLLEDLLVRLVGDAGLPLVHQGVGRGISLKDVFDLHIALPALWIVMGTAM